MTREDLKRLATRTQEKLETPGKEKDTYVVVRIFRDTSFLNVKSENENSREQEKSCSTGN